MAAWPEVLSDAVAARVVVAVIRRDGAEAAQSAFPGDLRESE